MAQFVLVFSKEELSEEESCRSCRNDIQPGTEAYRLNPNLSRKAMNHLRDIFSKFDYQIGSIFCSEDCINQESAEIQSFGFMSRDEELWCCVRVNELWGHERRTEFAKRAKAVNMKIMSQSDELDDE